MDKHVHLVVVPEAEQSLAHAIGRAHLRYSQYFNSAYMRSGHLWQSRFFSCPMDRDHGLNAMAYVELNPVRAGIVTWAIEFPWSSAATHCGTRPRDSLLDLPAWWSEWTPEAWEEQLAAVATNRDIGEAIRSCTRTGHPFGGEDFVAGLERKLGVSLRGRRGRPRGSQ
jgi:putative transposase